MWKKIIGIVVLVIVLAVGAVVAYLFLRKPAMASPSAIKVEVTPERIARGKHIFERLADCDGCHSQRDFARFGGPVVPGYRGAGFRFPSEMGMPGTIVGANITPDPETGIGRWTDGEKIRAIREGVDKDGRALFPMMPYSNYRNMSDEDVQALVAYLNNLPPVRNALPPTQIKFPVNLLIKGVPKPVGPVPPPDRSDRLKYGEYLATVGSCGDCHTPAQNGGAPTKGKEFSGGREFRTPMGTVISANITPDADTGIGKWSEQQFLDKFYQYKEYVENGPPKVGPESFTLMPWLGTAQLTPEELGAIFTYLKTLPPVRNAVETRPGQPQKAARLSERGGRSRARTADLLLVRQAL